MKEKKTVVTADCVVFDDDGRLLLIQRGKEPFLGKYALPGGHVDYGESVENAALRELKEETGIKGELVQLIGVYSKMGRDPRGHTVTVAFLARLSGDAELHAGDDAASAKFESSWEDKEFAFDHRDIIADAVKAREKMK